MFFLFAKHFLYQEINTKTLLERKKIVVKKKKRKKILNKLHAVSRGVCPEKGKKNIFYPISDLVYTHYVLANVFIKVIFSSRKKNNKFLLLYKLLSDIGWTMFQQSAKPNKNRKNWKKNVILYTQRNQVKFVCYNVSLFP